VEEVIGFDINKEALECGNTIIRNRFPKNVESKIKFKHSNLNKIESENNYFDSILDIHTLEHIFPEDLNQVVAEKNRILKCGGYVVLSIPYEKAFYGEGCKNQQHVSFFNEDTLKELFESNGFETIECYRDNRNGDELIDLCLTALFKKFEI
jgi:SAM-dependent methyltransferase